VILRTIFLEDFKLDDFILTKLIRKQRRANSIKVILEVPGNFQGDFQGFQGLPD
jgi:hypothetical protein